jgi:hypothetical protein
MITQGLVVLINYGIHLAPGLWFALTPQIAARCRCVLPAFVVKTKPVLKR